MERVVVVPPDPAGWREAFEAEAARLSAVFGENLLEIHHIGSTAVPGLAAKPIVDMLPVVRDLNLVDALNDRMAAFGYEARGEFGLPGRRYFTRNEGGTRTHNVHVYERGNPEVERHLAFRDYMAAHPEEVRVYSRLKEQLARRFPANFEAYMNGKDALSRRGNAAPWRGGEPEGDMRRRRSRRGHRVVTTEEE